jgi:hypothetical protein
MPGHGPLITPHPSAAKCAAYWAIFATLKDSEDASVLH